MQPYLLFLLFLEYFISRMLFASYDTTFFLKIYLSKMCSFQQFQFHQFSILFENTSLLSACTCTSIIDYEVSNCYRSKARKLYSKTST